MSTIKNLSVGDVLVAPSILAADFANLEDQMVLAEKGGADLFHIDVMDGHFVPNLTMGPPIVKSIRRVSDLIFDVHLMLTNPLMFIEPFAKAGSNHITFHIECKDDIDSVIKLIRKNSMSVGISVKPGTPVEEIYPFLEEIDLILIMSVEPGFGGQSFMYDMMQKVEKVYKKIKELNREIHIQVDGGIDAKTISSASDAGANIMVAGTSVFGAKDGIKSGIEILKSS